MPTIEDSRTRGCCISRRITRNVEADKRDTMGSLDDSLGSNIVTVNLVTKLRKSRTLITNVGNSKDIIGV